MKKTEILRECAGVGAERPARILTSAQSNTISCNTQVIQIIVNCNVPAKSCFGLVPFFNQLN